LKGTGPDRPPLLIAGTGALACMLGAYLSPVYDVTLLGSWAAGVEAVASRGIELIEAGEKRRYPANAVADALHAPAAPLAILAVKSWQTEQAALRLNSCLPPQGVVLTLQNGLGNLEVLEKILGTGRALQGVTSMGATLLGPGSVALGGKGPTYLISEPRLDGLRAGFEKVGLEVRPADDMRGLAWGKAAINAAINPLTALLRVPNGELLTSESTRSLMAAAAGEVAAVADGLGVRLPYDDAAAEAFEVARRTARNRSSMLQDIERGAPTQIDAICGAVVRQAQAMRRQAPVNEMLWHLILAAVAFSRGG
jgi:2-dehydropantoate 2-reductase